MTDKEIIEKLKIIQRHYDFDDWPLEDLRGDLEDIFIALSERENAR